MTREEIHAKVTAALVAMLDVEASAVSLDARLYEDLEMDSIDAVDMSVTMQELTGKRVDEKSLKRLRTVRDVVDLIAAELGVA